MPTVPTTDVRSLEPSHVTSAGVITESQFPKDSTKAETKGASSQFGFKELDPQQDMELLGVRPRVSTEMDREYQIELIRKERTSETLSPSDESKLICR